MILLIEIVVGIGFIYFIIFFKKKINANFNRSRYDNFHDRNSVNQYVNCDTKTNTKKHMNKYSNGHTNKNTNKNILLTSIKYTKENLIKYKNFNTTREKINQLF